MLRMLQGLATAVGFAMMGVLIAAAYCLIAY
jgi:hypothetical protein